MNHQVWILVRRQYGKRSVASASADLQHRRLRGTILGRQLRQDGKLLEEPLAVLEEVRIVVRVEEIPPLVRSIVEAALVEVGNGALALPGKGLLGEDGVLRVDFDVVPRVVCKDVVAVFEVALAELERVGALGVRAVVVRWAGLTVRLGGPATDWLEVRGYAVDGDAGWTAIGRALRVRGWIGG